MPLGLDGAGACEPHLFLGRGSWSLPRSHEAKAMLVSSTTASCRREKVAVDMGETVK